MKGFGKVQKKKKGNWITHMKSLKLNHASWTCVLALLQRWRGPSPRVDISTTLLITRSCWQCYVLPAAMSKTASQTGARVILPLLDLWRSESQLHVWMRLQDPGTSFFQTCCAPFVENARWSSAWRYGRATNLRLQKHWKRKTNSPGWNQCRTHWVRQIGALSAWVLSARLDFHVYAGTLPSRQRTGPRPPKTDVWVRTVRKSRPPFAKQSEVSSKHRAYGVRVLFFIFTYFRNGQGQPPTPSPKRACPYFGKCGNLRTVPKGLSKVRHFFLFFFFKRNAFRMRGGWVGVVSARKSRIALFEFACTMLWLTWQRLFIHRIWPVHDIATRGRFRKCNT